MKTEFSIYYGVADCYLLDAALKYSKSNIIINRGLIYYESDSIKFLTDRIKETEKKKQRKRN